ncbi:hypothetical protein EJ04DRAFT_504296 [Polyplosphaeria fusca]|uniref:NUC153 domain-containing protein n=1 Tax=Polyplosphaeria fusca TaxID=682080 RepID=A0A9P4UWY1_9PLEO|nr:hypothetical protein EJ04DRAFT_504296 [Polyplosphaeria fusca]
MPLPKRQVAPVKFRASRDGAEADNRFANFQTDPKFRLPSTKKTKTKLDARFSRILTDSDFYSKASVDKCGRKLNKDAGRKELQKRFYQEEEDSDNDNEDDEELDQASKTDRAVRKELAKADLRGPNYDPIRDGGFSSSSSDESSSDEDDEYEDHVEDETELPAEGSEVPVGDVTSRLAAVNLDWDNIRAADLMAVANSFIPAGGRIIRVVIYPSEFGRERMEREALDGPPREIFASTAKKNEQDLAALDNSSDGSDPEADAPKKNQPVKDGSGEEFDSKALRAYQLDRLRYYYAIITCSSPKVAKVLYDDMDGREYLTSANFFDLRFVPDDTTFDEDPHDECETLPQSYKPNEFTTDALTHSKVKLTWDADDTTRKEAQKRAFTQKEVDENDLQAYLGTDSSSDDDAGADKSSKVASIRAALGLGSSSKSKAVESKRGRDFKRPEGEMQVTFTAGLSTDAKGSVFENEPEETTIEKYKRKERERRAKRKERWNAKQQGLALDDTGPKEQSTPAAETLKNQEDDPWNDPFFGSDTEAAKVSEASSKKLARKKQREEREKAQQQSAAERAQLELLMADEKGSKVHHFDMNEIIKAEKAKKKDKKTKNRPDAPVVEDDFEMNVNDPRFAKLYESHEFAIDPTNPRYKNTQGMKALLEEGRKKRKHGEADSGETKKKKRIEQSAEATDDLKKLAARVKAKSKV